ncbi:unnamed protein product [Cunninghamella blakesleeana]
MTPNNNTTIQNIPTKQKRKKWTEKETDSLILGCMMHGVGNWKTIVKDPTLTFYHWSAVEFKRQQGINNYYLDSVNKVAAVHRKKRRERRLFNDEEDEALLKGIEKYGVAWSKIAKDPQLNLSHRKGVDLRDRLRNKFPEKYVALGFHLTSQKRQQQHKFQTISPLSSPLSESSSSESLHEKENDLQNENNQ